MKSEYKNLFKRIQSVVEDTDSTNHERRVLCAEAELFRIKLSDAPCNEDDQPQRDAEVAELDALLTGLKLKRVKHFWYDSIDRWVCGLAGWVWLLTATVFLAPPVMLLKPLDAYLVKRGVLSPQSQISEYIEEFIANTMLLISGADMVVISGDKNAFAQSECPLVCFSHGSTLDTFVLGSLIPMQQNTLAKKELFLIPFLNLLLYTFGGIPIDRNDRNAAVSAIDNAMRSAETVGSCIMIAPEGTRSKTGNLLPFKKGPFYIWEDVQSTIIPVVITGAFELCPPGYFMNLPGRIYAQQLPPIPFDHNQTRESISKQLRVQMLEAIKKSPADAGSAISWGFRIKNILSIVALAVLQYWIYQVPCKLLMTTLRIGYGRLWFYLLCISIIVTMVLYFFKILLPKRSKPPPRSPTKSTTPVKSKTRKAD